ncbi:MAG TPA: LacI family DNA-binding transcriptional regulator [Microlunatus sp.]
MSKTTMRDVAERSGVSVTTVSHVLNDVPGKRINPQTRSRVLRAADELLYRPNQLARGLRTQRSGMIGFLSDQVSTTPYAGRMIVGAQAAAEEVGSLLLLLDSGGDPDLEEREVEALRERQVDGIVYATYYHRVVHPPANLADGPVVLLDARSADGSISSVVPDEVGGARSAVEVLLAAGHRRIGFVTTDEEIAARDLRLTGYRQALEVYGLPFDPALVALGGADAQAGFAAAHQLLAPPGRPTAIFCFKDLAAMGVYQAAGELGLSIPEDLSVVGFDDQLLISESLRPGLTTVALPHEEMGRWAVRTLLERIDAPSQPASATHALLPCPVVSRGSVARPATGPP